MKTGGTGGANTNASGRPFEECFRPTGTRIIGGKSFTYFTQDEFVRSVSIRLFQVPLMKKFEVVHASSMSTRSFTQPLKIST